MRKILILFAVALIGFASCADSKQSMTVTVTNPLALERTGEMVEVPMSDVVAKLKLADTAQIVVLDVDGQQVPYPVSYTHLKVDKESGLSCTDCPAPWLEGEIR